jgi:capsular exopolysaccharide synthesis family protein
MEKINQVIRNREKTKRRAMREESNIGGHESSREPAAGRSPSGEDNDNFNAIDFTLIKNDKGHLYPDKNLVTVVEPKSIAAEQYRSLRTKVELSMKKKGYRTFQLTSATRGEGKTLTTVNLALVMAQQVKKKTVLVDTDLRKPRVHQALGIQPKAGLSNILQDNLGIEAATIRSRYNGLYVIPAGKTPKNPSELIGSQRMQNLINRLRQDFDCVFFDSPPVIPVADPNILCSMVDGLIFVLRAEQTPREALDKALEILDAKNVLGFVLNAVEATFSNRYYYQYYYYD